MTDPARPEALIPLFNALTAFVKSDGNSNAFDTQLDKLDPTVDSPGRSGAFGPSVKVTLSIDAETLIERGGLERDDDVDPEEVISDAFRDEIAFEFESSTDVVRELASEAFESELDYESRVLLEEALVAFEEIAAGLRETFEASGGELTEDEGEALLEAFFDAEEAFFETLDDVSASELSESQEDLADEFIDGFEGVYDAFDALTLTRTLLPDEETRIEAAEANFFLVFDEIFAEEREATDLDRVQLQEALRAFADTLLGDISGDIGG